MGFDFVPTHAIEDAWKADIEANLKNDLGLKTIETFETEYQQKKLSSLMALSPFVLINYAAAESDEKEIGQASVGFDSAFHVYIGSQNLSGRRAGQKGCYTIMEALRKRYDGGILTIADPSAVIVLSWLSERIFVSEGGLIVYQQIFQIHQ